MRSNAAAASMQKTYDECYLICSTAVYYEKQNNEEEALKSWRSALDQIYYHNAYRVPANYKAKSETEKALQDSLHDMEMQCKERVDLLGALRKSRLEASQSQDPSATPSSSVQRQQAPFAAQSSKLKANGTIGDGTIPAVNYPDLAKPTFLNRPTIQRPPLATREASGSNISQNGSPSLTPQTTGPGSKASSSTTLPVPPGQPKSRTPSPEKKPGVLKTTLRPVAKESKSAPGKFSTSGLRGRQKPAAAATAASVAWPSGFQPSSEINAPTNTMSQPQMNNGNNSGSYLQPGPVAPQTIKQASMSPRPKISATNSMSDRTANANGASPSSPRSGQHLSARSSSHLLVSSDAGSVNRSLKHAAPSTAPRHNSRSVEESPNFQLSAQMADVYKQPSSRISHESSYKVAPDTQQPSPTPLPQPEFPSYRREYPKPEAMDPRKVESIMASRNISADTYKAAPSLTSAQIRAQQPQITRQKSPARKKAPPIPRKAVAGTPPSSSGRPSASSPSDQGHSRNESEGEAVVAELPGMDMDSERATAAAWDARVKHLMKNLPRGVDEQAAKSIFNEIVIKGDEVHWDDVAGLDVAKGALKEAVVYPFLRPDLFLGLREPARGMLLFGPPGTGKTMLARAVATESRSTFFAISASSLTSKFLGESEKLVRALFTLAKVLAPSIIFVDEIDSLLSSRSGSGEHEATRRIKTEFLIQWSDLQKAAAGKDPSGDREGDATRVLVLAATNLPWAIDEAARRRFVRRQYIPLPEPPVRGSQLRRLMSAQKHNLKPREIEALVELTDGFSGSDITALAKDAAMGPLRSLGEKLLSMSPDEIRPIGFIDFEASLVNIRPSVSKQGLQEYEDWAKEFGERGG